MGFDPPAVGDNCVWTLLSLYPLSHHSWIIYIIIVFGSILHFLAHIMLAKIVNAWLPRNIHGEYNLGVLFNKPPV